MKSTLRILLLSMASALAIAACSVEGVQTGTSVGDASNGDDKAWQGAFNRGKENLASGHLGLAVQHFRAALAVNPESARILNALAVTYDRLGRNDLAQHYFDQALAIDPNSPTILNNVGYAMLTRQRYEEALIYFEQAMKQQQTPTERRMTTANRQLALDRLRLARQHEAREEVVKASLAAADRARASADCGAPSASAVGRTGARVFTLITQAAGTGSGTTAADNGRAARDVMPFAQECPSAERARVAIIKTEPQPVAVASLERGVKEPVAMPAQEPAKAAGGVANIRTEPQPAPVMPVERQVMEVVTASDQKAGQPADSVVSPEVTTVPVTPVAAKDTTPKGLLRNVTVEISNGAGRNKLAARLRAYLEARGYEISYLTNAARFDNKRTTIFYKRGYRAAAEAFAKQLPVPVEFVQFDKHYADVRIRLGADILEFDRNVLYAAAMGERHV